MLYQQALLYVMSGTGNTRRVAMWMREIAAQAGVDCHVVPFERAQPAVEIAGANTLFGLLMPTHGFTAPWAMIRFALRLPRRHADAFVVATRAGIMIGRYAFPGMEGTACYLLALILALKGYRVRGVQALDMPSNWTALHWGMNAEHVAAIIARAQPKAEGFFAQLLDGKPRFGGYVALGIGLLLAQISCLYLLIGRFMLAKLFFANRACNGCGLCAGHCPVGAIRLFGTRRPRPYWTFACESCMRCMNFCPQRAIEAGQSWAVLLGYLSGIPLLYWLLSYIERHLAWADALARYLAQLAATPSRASLPHTLLHSLLGLAQFLLIRYPNVLLVMGVSYLLFTLALRIPLANWLFTYTSFTHYYRRYHEPGLSLQELSEEEKTVPPLRGSLGGVQ